MKIPIILLYYPIILLSCYRLYGSPFMWIAICAIWAIFVLYVLYAICKLWKREQKKIHCFQLLRVGKSGLLWVLLALTGSLMIHPLLACWYAGPFFLTDYIIHENKSSKNRVSDQRFTFQTFSRSIDLYIFVLKRQDLINLKQVWTFEFRVQYTRPFF